MAKNIELYYNPWCFYCMKTRMYLAEKGVKAKLHIVELIDGENLKDEFLRINPRGLVPVLKTSDATVPDSEEIYKYGEENIPGDNLVPSDIADDIWKFHDLIHKLNVTVPTFGCFTQPKFRENVKLPDDQKEKGAQIMPNALARCNKMLPSASSLQVPVISSKIERLKPLLKKVEGEEALNEAIDAIAAVLKQCESQLEKSEGPFLFGATVTVADIDLIVLIERCRMLGLESRIMPHDECPKLLAFVEAMSRRSSYRMMVEDGMTYGKSFKTNYWPVFIVLGSAAAAVALAVGVALLVHKSK